MIENIDPKKVDDYLALQERCFSGFWTPVSESLPIIGQINGFWDSVPVIVALDDGRVCGAFFTYVGGDDMDSDDEGKPLPEHLKPEPSFETDEGLAYSKVLFWAVAPKHPTMHRKVPRTYA